MAEYFRFFNSTVEDPREYQAADFAEYFKMFLSNGVFNEENSLEVSAEGSNMSINVNNGYAFIKGYLYKNDSIKVLTHADADAFQDRIDRIVVRFDNVNRNISTVIKQGVKSDNPIAPNLEQTEALFEISLAQVRIIAGKSYIDRIQVTDERMDENVCGYVSSLIQIPTNEMWNDWNLSKISIQNDWSTWFNSAKNEYSKLELSNINDDLQTHKETSNPHKITPGQIGAEPVITKNTGFNKNKSDSISSIDSNTLATSNAVKIAYDRAVSAEGNSKAYTNTHENKSNPHDITISKIGAEPAFTKRTGFNKNKSDTINSTSSETLATSKAVKAAYDKGVEALNKANTKENAFNKNTGFNKNKSDSVTSTNTNTLATSKAVKIAYDRAVSSENNAKSYTDSHEGKSNPHGITTAKIGAETPSGAQSKANTAETNAKSYTDSHENKTSPHSGHVKGNMSISVGISAPSSPLLNDIWIDTSEG